MHLFLSADDSEPFLMEELRRAFPAAQHQVIGPRLLRSDATIQPASPPVFAFARQCLPEAQPDAAQSISAWSDRLMSAVLMRFPEEQPWALHIEPRYGVTDAAGRNRCRLIRESFRDLLRRKRRRLLRSLRSEPELFTPAHSLVQFLLTSPDAGWISVAPAPLAHQFRAIISPFPSGEIPVAVDKAAPSRAFAKLVEAELRLGRRIQSGDVCVDLGAAPGSWTYVALTRGARVTAVDRSPLREDLMSHPALTFHQGDAFAFVPEERVDWLVCDVIAAPDRSIDLVLDWVQSRRTRQFVVTIKFKGQEDYLSLERLKHAVAPFCSEFYLTRLCANRNEACVFGVVSEAPSTAWHPKHD